MNAPVTVAFYGIAVVTVAFQLLQFSELYAQATDRWDDETALAIEDVCTDSAKKYRYRDRVDCEGAQRGATQSPLGSAFEDWVQSRYLYQLLTLSDWSTWFAVLAFGLYTIRLLLGNHNHRPPLPALGAPPPSLMLAPTTEQALLGAAAASIRRGGGRSSSSRSLVPTVPLHVRSGWSGGTDSGGDYLD